ncbi:MAG: Rab family GTPase [Promethearchaeota archaeon]
MSGVIFKIIAIGDIAVGKTSIVTRYVDDKFDPKYQATIGVAHALKRLVINKQMITLSIWDTGGQEVFDYIRTHYFAGANGALIVYDVTRNASFNHLDRWFNDVYKNCGDIPVILVGNKIDLTDELVISAEQGEQYAHQKDVTFYETSAKTGENIVDVMEELAKTIFSEKNTIV